MEEKMPSACTGGPLRAMGMPSHMEINGNREVVLEGCRGVLEYDTETVRVRMAKFNIRFTGRGLVIKCLNPESMVIEGFLTGVEFLVS